VSACARCGTAHERSKEFCLSCGIRLPARAARWQRSGLHRANPLWSALAILVLGALGALAAIVATRSDGGGETLVATNLPARTDVQTPPVIGRSAAGVPTTNAPPVLTAPPPAPSKPKVTTLTEWTASDGYTIVLASIPSANGRANAEEFAKQALAKGLAHVGVLDSQDFSSLHPGYFVVFSGFYRSNDAAASHISQVEAAGLGPAYARRITR
jgi:hypothetical protein